MTDRDGRQERQQAGFRSPAAFGAAFDPSPTASAAFVFLLSFAVCASVLAWKRPVGRSFLADEWYQRGVNLRLYGTLGHGDEPVTFRPPGYPAFIAAVLATQAPQAVPDERAAAGEPAILNAAFGDDGPIAVYLAQSLLLAACSALLFLWGSAYLPRGVAWFAGLLFGTNPYSVITAFTLHYDVLHMFGLVAAGWCLHAALRLERRRLPAMCLAGLTWGLVSLVRPMTLILPPFVFLLALVTGRLPVAAALRATGIFTLGMAIAITPWTWRNHRVAERIIPVNSQAWVALWASSVTRLPRDPNHLRWHTVWASPERKEVERTVRPKGFANYPQGMGFNLALEDAFRAQALANLKARPGVYLHNAAVGFLTFALDIDTVLIRVFEYVQRPDFRRLPVGWFAAGKPQDFHSGRHADAFARFVAVLTALSAWGLLVAARRGDRAVAVPAAIAACLCLAHSVTWMDLRYYYVKLPFLFLFAAYGFAAAQRAVDRWLPGRGSGLLALGVGGALVVWCFWLSAQVLL